MGAIILKQRYLQFPPKYLACTMVYLSSRLMSVLSVARTASRGNSNREFIRSGQTSALVEIRLLNTGDEAYKPEVYGENIVVSRSVTQTSSIYKLKDARGRVVVDKKVKEELDRILIAFNIQVRLHYCW